MITSELTYTGDKTSNTSETVNSHSGSHFEARLRFGGGLEGGSREAVIWKYIVIEIFSKNI